MTAFSLSQAWESLKSSNKDRIGWESIDWEHYGSFVVRAAVRYPDLQQAIMIGYPKGTGLPDKELPMGKGFSVLKLENGPSTEKEWLTLCKEPDWDDSIFAGMAEDLQTVLKLTNRSAEARLKAFIERIRLWQGFMEKVKTRKLGSAAQRELIAQLWTLQELFKAGIDEGLLLLSWIAPFNFNKDFEFENVFVEVKTSAPPRSNIVKIQTLEQLDRHGKELFLVHYHIDEDEKGKSLGTIIMETREMFSEDSRIVFDNLMPISLDDDVLAQYTRKFVNSGRKVFIVDDKFPSLARSKIPVEITSAEYELDVFSLSRYSVLAQQLFTSLGLKENGSE